MTSHLGEFEQMVLLAVMQLKDDAYAIGIRQRLKESAQRRVTRGALYRTLDRMESKGLLRWTVHEPTEERGGHPRRCFEVTADGIAALRSSRRALFKLWEGLESTLGEP